VLDFFFAILALGALLTIFIVPWMIYGRVAVVAESSDRVAKATEGIEYVMRELLDRIENEDAKRGRDEDDDDDDEEDDEVNDLGALEKLVAEAFSNDPILGPLLEDFDIEAMDGGVIELTGSVKNHEIWQRAVDVTNQVDGVNEVISYLTIGTNDHGADKGQDLKGSVGGD
jgi:hypothetical protein